MCSVHKWAATVPVYAVDKHCHNLSYVTVLNIVRGEQRCKPVFGIAVIFAADLEMVRHAPAVVEVILLDLQVSRQCIMTVTDTVFAASCM